MIPKFHLKQQKGELTLLLLAKRILDDVREKWRSKKASGGRTLCLHLAREQALLFGRAKLAARERASERRSREGPRGLSLPYLRL